MATARFTAGAVLDTVTVAATTVVGALDTVSNGVGMLNAFVSKAAEEQRKRYLIDAATMDQRLVDEAARDQATRRRALDKELDADPVFKDHYLEAHAEFLAILKPKAKLSIAAE